MSNREMELFVMVILYCKWCDDSNPDVGMGPNLNQLAARIVKRLSFPVTAEEIKTATDRVQAMIR